MRRATWLGTWILGTLLSMAFVALSASLVQARVTEHSQALPVVRRQDLTEALDAARASDATASSTTRPVTLPAGGPGGSAPDAPAPDGAGARVGPVAPGESRPPAGPGAGPTAAPTTTRPPAPPTSTPATGPVPTPPPSLVDDRRGGGGGGSPGGPLPTIATTTTTAKPPPLPVSSTLEIHATGGWTLVRCTGPSATLVSYLALGPQWVTTVVKWGPADVEVQFRSVDHLSRIRARCDNGRVIPDVSESAV